MQAQILAPAAVLVVWTLIMLMWLALTRLPPLFKQPGIGNLYIDTQGTQGYMYAPGNNFESYSFRNPTTGQAWSGALTTLGPQLSIGLIQGANQSGSGLVLPGPPRQTAPLPSIQSTILDDIP